MNAILVPIDFSENSINALRYAVELARVNHASITLFNSYHVAITASLTATPPSEYIDSLIDDRAQSHEKRLRQIASQFETVQYEKTDEQLAFDFLTLQGVASEQIEELTYSDKFSMVVMGTKGASGLAEVLWGSIAAYVVKNAQIPVLVVPEKAQNLSLKKIVYATNFDDNDIKAIDYVRNLTKAFDSEFTCLHISSSRNDSDEIEKLEDLESHYWFTPVSRMSFELLKDKKVEQALKSYFKENHVNLFVTLPQHKGFLERILSGSLTQQFTLHSDLPILVFKLKEEKKQLQ